MKQNIITVGLSNEFVPLDRLQHGQIALANDTRLVEGSFSEPLTAFAVGYRDPSNIEEALEFIAPAVPVGGRRFEFKKATNAEEFYSETDDVRGIGSDFKRVEYKGTDVVEKTLNKGLTIRVDLDQVDGMPSWREIYTGRIMRRLFRNELRRGITLLAASATNGAKTWDSTALKDPDADVMEALEAGAEALGLSLNRVLFGQTAWRKRVLSLRAQNLKGQADSSTMTPANLAEWLGVDEVRVSRERYQSTATAKAQIVNNLVLAFYAEAGMGAEDPSSIKRFVSSVEGGGTTRVYEQQVSAKLVDITVEHYSNIVATSTTGIRKLTIS